MRIDQITFVRFIAAISIVVFHYGKDIFPFSDPHLLPVINRANIGVSFFFLLSGFVMMIAYFKANSLKLDPIQYFKNRIARIYPIYLIALVLIIIYDIVEGYKINSFPALLDALALQSWFPAFTITLNQPGWSLSVEFFFYLLFPFLLNRVYHKYSFKTLAAGIVIFWCFSQIFFNYLLSTKFYHGWPSVSHNFLFFFPVMHLNEFLLGNLAGMLFLRMDKKFFGNYDIIIGLFFISFILLLKYPLSINYHNGFLAIVLVPFIFFLAASNGIITKQLKRKPFVFLGEISYSLYILQMPVYLILYKILNAWGIHQKTILFYVSLCLLIIFSGLSYTYIETPLRNWLKHFSPGHYLHHLSLNRHIFYKH